MPSLQVTHHRLSRCADCKKDLDTCPCKTCGKLQGRPVHGRLEAFFAVFAFKPMDRQGRKQYRETRELEKMLT